MRRKCLALLTALVLLVATWPFAWGEIEPRGDGNAGSDALATSTPAIPRSPSAAEIDPTAIPDLFRIEDGVLLAYLGDAEKVVIPDDVHTIGPDAFKDHPQLKILVLGKEVRIIKASAFFHCLKLEKVIPNELLEEVGAAAFAECPKLDVTFLDELMATKEIKVAADAFRDSGTEASPSIKPTEVCTSTAEPTEAPTPTAESTEASTPTVEPTEEPTPTAEPTEAPTPTAEPTEAPTPTTEPTEAPTPTAELTEAPTPTAEPTEPPTPTAEPTEVSTPTTEPTEVPTPTAEPTEVPTPTAEPTEVPTPTAEPTEVPTPTVEPTEAPTPTVEPTEVPTPTAEPTEAPTPTAEPTEVPTPTAEPTEAPTPTAEPTEVPTPTAEPTEVPTPTAEPTEAPTPTAEPSEVPTPTPEPTEAPTPTSEPTEAPTPTAEPTEAPTPTTEPTEAPTPTAEPTDAPTPTLEPTEVPSPTAEPTEAPTPTVEPTEAPTPTAEPTEAPTPTAEPTEVPTPTAEPTEVPTPTAEPTEAPTPTAELTEAPTPTAEPTEAPTPTAEPTEAPTPTAEPTEDPTPTAEPTEAPTPTVEPTEAPTPTVEPTEAPTPTAEPTEAPTPTAEPTEVPTPTVEPTEAPTPTAEPTEVPTPTPEPTPEPTATPAPDTGIAEAAEGTNWLKLKNSGWFEAYSHSAMFAAEENVVAANVSVAAVASTRAPTAAPGTTPSAVQVVNSGGTNSDDKVSVSKVISGTELENVFDITLTVKTQQKIEEVYSEPEMAVVIVMDISNTMNDNFGGTTRYAAAMEAAEDFLDKFAEHSNGVSKVGYVAFNTDAHQIFGLSNCTSKADANALKNTMRTATGNIINASGYKDSHSRFTNVEAGLKMGYDMLASATQEYKYIIFLSDGFPTTYIRSGYSGYDPYDSTGRFYDHVLHKKCLYGTSYSDEAAIRARKMATSIKNSGVTIFSIGVDVGGQTIQAYITSSENSNGFSIVDRTGTTYEIGSATSTSAYKSWLQYSIGSGYYYDSTNTSGLKAAYDAIFAEILKIKQEASKADWVAEDPLPSSVGNDTGLVEFIGFYDKDGTLVSTNLTNPPTGENTATFLTEKSAINWDLKNSAYVTAVEGSTTTYTYTLKYRVRLENEEDSFAENDVYATNDRTTLTYRVVEAVNGQTVISDKKTLDFPIPSVKGYLAELAFQKIDSYNRPVQGAVFTLTHADTCAICKGNGTQVDDVQPLTATSGEDGKVSFTGIPSGHHYLLKETSVPDGYLAYGYTYTVYVDYDQVNVVANGSAPAWESIYVNYTSVELPATGGLGSLPYLLGGLLLCGLACLAATQRNKRGVRST